MTEFANGPTGATPVDRVARPPVFGWIGVGCALLAIPSARLAAEFLVTREDLAGYYGLWTGLLTLLIVLGVGIVASSISLLRRESPRWISLIAAAANLGLIATLVLFMA